jgi:thiamine biosynthesis lipoprotein
VPEEFITLLEISKKIYKETFGYFSIAVGAITKKRYFFGQTEAKIPTDKQLDSANTDLLGFSVKKSRVSLGKDVVIDFGGIAKGFTVQKVKEFLDAQGLKHFQIALSGDIYCKGSCRIAIQSPFERHKHIKVLELKDAAISTSGNYERYIQSKKHNHLINPKTKRSQQKIASMTLYSHKHNNTTLDALATALSVMPQATREKVLKNFPGISYLYVTVDGNYHASQGED